MKKSFELLKKEIDFIKAIRKNCINKSGWAWINELSTHENAQELQCFLKRIPSEIIIATPEVIELLTLSPFYIPIINQQESSGVFEVGTFFKNLTAKKPEYGKGKSRVFQVTKSLVSHEIILVTEKEDYLIKLINFKF